MMNGRFGKATKGKSISITIACRFCYGKCSLTMRKPSVLETVVTTFGCQECGARLMGKYKLKKGGDQQKKVHGYVTLLENGNDTKAKKPVKVINPFDKMGG